MPKVGEYKSGALIVLACCFVSVMTSCLGKTVLIAQQASPTGKYLAELREGDAGAVGGWMCAIRVSKINPDLWTRLLGREADTVFGANVPHKRISFDWEEHNHLRIGCNGCQATEIQLHKGFWEGVMISYDLSSRDVPDGK